MAKTIALLGLLVLAAAGSGAHAIEPVNETSSGLAIHGYDPVAYFEDGRPVKGDAAIGHEWQGATWLFATREHRDTFAADPEKYAPQYGGYCAKAVSENTTADIDPASWSIVGGKLYLNYSPKIKKLWEQDPAGRITRGDANWPGLLSRSK
jgi:YHS domain-containing protein